MIDQESRFRTDEGRTMEIDPEFALVESKGILATQIVAMIATVEQPATKQAPTIAKYDVYDVLFGVIASLENVIAKIDAILERDTRTRNCEAVGHGMEL